MNTKTMRLPPRRVLTPSKRKEREGPDTLKPSTPTKLTKPTPSQAGSDKVLDSASSNQLLAGYLAHEYLTKGTFFGQPWDPARAEAVPVSSGVDPIPDKPSHGAESESTGKAEPNKENYQRYVETRDEIGDSQGRGGGGGLPLATVVKNRDSELAMARIADNLVPPCLQYKKRHHFIIKTGLALLPLDRSRYLNRRLCLTSHFTQPYFDQKMKKTLRGRGREALRLAIIASEPTTFKVSWQMDLLGVVFG
ncbi:unnamed protein product [Dovyalis caffra]|uniref:Uncharacterized protein n=1 Tax=Dovyalis caffra TaxID=77055 RepID=A0AAV1SCZ2_9ROSI|nr:unnamed protein product [Dovyalis caffra]